MNLCTFAGNIGRTPELKTTPQGQQVCNFSVAVKRRQRDADSLWIECSAWGRTAEFVEKHFSKGSGIIVTGSVDLEVYQTREGETRAKITLTASTVDFPPPRGSGKDDQDAPNTSAPSNQGNNQQSSNEQGGDDDLPF